MYSFIMEKSLNAICYGSIHLVRANLNNSIGFTLKKKILSIMFNF